MPGRIERTARAWPSRPAGGRPALDGGRQPRAAGGPARGTIQGFFNIPVDHLFASPVLVGYVRDLNLPDLTIVLRMRAAWSARASFAKKLEVPLAIVGQAATT